MIPRREEYQWKKPTWRYFFNNIQCKQGVVVFTYNPSTQEAEARGLRI
jgi:hypothetical protein